MDKRHRIGIWLMLFALLFYMTGSNLPPAYELGRFIRLVAILVFMVGSLILVRDSPVVSPVESGTNGGTNGTGERGTMTEICEARVRANLVAFTVGTEKYQAEFIFPSLSGPGLVRDENLWRLSRAVYQSHRQGLAIQRERQVPRYKKIGVFDTLDGVRGYLRERSKI